MKFYQHKFALFFSLFLLIISSEGQAKTNLQDALLVSYQAPEISGIEKWFNSKPQKISQLKGKVVLIDFWTYSCINCLRTLPHLKEIYEKYHSQGLEIIGVHAPEFEFEKNPQNVEKAIARFGIKYPVALDNKLQTWQNFENQYWPAHYLINQQSKVVYTHFGEGHYDVLENNIAALLNKSAPKYKKEKAKKFALITQETYLGIERGVNNFNDSLDNLTFPKTLPTHGWALQGDWKIANQFVESQKSNAALRLNFISSKVYLVMASKNGEAIQAEITLNGKKLSLGKDVIDGKVTINESRLYELVNQNSSQVGLLEIRALNGGLQAYAFTFGE